MEELLKQLGLAPGEAAVYQALLERESGSPAELAQFTKLKRPDTYNKLAELVKKGLVEEIGRPTSPKGLRGAGKRYRLEHPQKLQDYLNQREQALKTVERQLDSALPELTSRYQLAAHKPGVSYFEGAAGIQTVAFDALKTTGVIYSYIDNEAIEKYALDMDAKFVSRRDKLGIDQRILVTNSAFNRKYFESIAPNVHNVRYINFPLPPFGAEMMIYDNKVSYLTFKPNAQIGIIIEDSHIAAMHKSLFEYTWSAAERPALTQP